MSDAEAFLAAIGRIDDARIDIAGAALAIAALDRPGIIIGRYQHHLDVIARDVAAVGADAQTADERAGVLRAVMAGRHQYIGDDESYDNLENANLMSVIDRRKGLPVALSILYIHAARAQDWPVEGINFPGHFLVRVQGTGDRAIIDPFQGGKLMSVGELRALVKQVVSPASELDPQFFSAVSDRDILVRLQNNIRARALKAGDIPQAIDVLYRLVQLAPEHIDYWYELGMLELHRERVALGRQALERCLMLLDHRPENDDMRQRVMNALNEIRSGIQ